jgi:hypothetical protein
MPSARSWGRVRVVSDDGTVLATLLLGGVGLPDMATVDEVARLGLWATRAGASVVVVDATAELARLLGLAGLPVEVRRQAEGGEQALRVEEGQEEGHFGDPAS